MHVCIVWIFEALVDCFYCIFSVTITLDKEHVISVHALFLSNSRNCYFLGHFQYCGFLLCKSSSKGFIADTMIYLVVQCHFRSYVFLEAVSWLIYLLTCGRCGDRVLSKMPYYQYIIFWYPTWVTSSWNHGVAYHGIKSWYQNRCCTTNVDDTASKCGCGILQIIHNPLVVCLHGSNLIPWT